MATADVLKQILKQFALTAPQAVGDSFLSNMNPQMYQQQQLAKRQQEQLAQQLKLHNSMSPYEQAQIAHQSQQMHQQEAAFQQQQQVHADQQRQQEFANKQQIAAGIASGAYQQLQPEGTVSTQIGRQQQQEGNWQAETGAAPGNDAWNAMLGILPQAHAAPQMVQAPPPPQGALQAGGLIAEPRQDAQKKRTVFIDPKLFGPDDELGRILAARGITQPMEIDSDKALDYFQEAATKATAAKEQADQRKAVTESIDRSLKVGHAEIAERFSPEYYKNNHGGKVDPSADSHRRAMDAQLEAAATSGRKAFSPTELTHAMEEIRKFVSPWEKVQEKVQARAEAASERAATRADTKAQQAMREVDRGWEARNKELNDVEKPLVEWSDRFQRLKASLLARNPAIDPVIAPELLTVIAGGKGSGVRVTDTELERILHGRSKIEDFKAVMQKWLGDGKALPDSQRENMLKFLDHLQEKRNKKMELLTRGRGDLADSKDIDSQHRLLNKLRTELDHVDFPSVQDQLGQPDKDPLGVRSLLPKR